MKTVLSFTTSIVLFLLLFTTQVNLSSCTKDPVIIHDTTTVHDTTKITLRDTIKLTLAPYKNPNEASVNSYYPTGSGIGTIQIVVGAWTHSSSPEISRTYVKFDYSDLPANPVIISAELSLYSNPTPVAGNFIDAHYGISNSIFIQRITTNWSPESISWTNQPESTTDNQISLPVTTSNFQNDLDINVTNLVKDMMVNGNNGFALQLQNEAAYNIRQYASSYNTNSDKMPKLVIYYKKS